MKSESSCFKLEIKFQGFYVSEEKKRKPTPSFSNILYT